MAWGVVAANAGYTTSPGCQTPIGHDIGWPSCTPIEVLLCMPNHFGSSERMSRRVPALTFNSMGAQNTAGLWDCYGGTSLQLYTQVCAPHGCGGS